jgi:50S ribosomal subunit-associated GTPase HflX
MVPDITYVHSRSIMNPSRYGWTELGKLVLCNVFTTISAFENELLFQTLKAKHNDRLRLKARGQ